MTSNLTQILLGSLLDSPAVVEMASQVGGKAVSIVKEHFTFTAYEVTGAYQDSYGYALAAIRLGVIAPAPSLVQKVRYSKITREFAQQIERQYLQPFVQQQGVEELAVFREQVSEALLVFSKHKDGLLEIQEISEEDLAALISYQQTLAMTDLLLEQMSAIAPVDEGVAAFLRYEGLLGNAVLFFFRELLRKDPRLAATQTALQQAKLCIEVQNLQATIADLRVQQDKYPVRSEQIEQQVRGLQQWQTQHESLLRFASQFESWRPEIVAWAEDIYAALGKLEEDVGETRRLVERFDRKLNKLLAQRGLSSQVSPGDGVILYDDESCQLIQGMLEQLKRLPSQTPGYGQLSMKLGSVLSSSGDLVEAEHWFLQAVDKANNDEVKALAYYNLFQVRWRKAFTELNSPLEKGQGVAKQAEIYAEALAALQQAIELSDGRLALHDINKGYYPIIKMLGAGGMGCALLCENHNFMLEGHQQVVVKCFWETPSGNLKQVFKEPLTMNNIAGDYVPTALDFGYADNQNKNGAYFVTEYIDGAIDGEAWLEKYGPLDLITGLQVALQIAEGLQKAHEKEIYHLDLKPANLLLKKTAEDSNTAAVSVKIIDFGLARVTTSLRARAEKQSRSGLTVFGHAFGTMEYAPPEQRGLGYGRLSAKSDLFAFGATMYRLWSGNSPRFFRERDLPQVSALCDLVFECVTENPTQRPASVQRLIERLRLILEAQLQKQQTAERQVEEAERLRQQQEAERLIQEQQTIEAKRQAEKERFRQQQEAERQAEEAERVRQEQEAKRQAEEAKRLRQEQEAKRQAEEAERVRKQQEAERQAEAERLRKQQEAKRQAEAERLRKEAIEKRTKRQLSPFNPLDHLRLLWWTLVMPQYLEGYYGEDDVGNWLVSTLVWLPLWMPTLALGLEWLPTTAYAWSPNVYLWISVVLGGFWLLTGWFGDMNEDWVVFVASFVAFVVAVVVAVGVAAGVALVVAVVVAGGVAGVVAFLVTLFGLGFGEEFIGTVKESLRTGTPSWIGSFAFVLLVVAHLFLIYYCFLGGWRLFV
jgi:serine/threonine protein kinase